MPFLSVLVPVYNGERYLASALDSALSQPCRDLEVVVADDGSTDGSLRVAREYAARDPRVRVLTHANVGPGMTRNLALPALRGRWVLFLDCDDIVLPGFYSGRVRGLLADCLDRGVECVVPARLYADESMSRAVLDRVPHEGAFPRGSIASWDVDYEFATVLYSLAMLRRERITFGVLKPAEMESIFRHKAAFAARRTLFTNRLWFAVRRDNPDQATRKGDWNTVRVDRIRLLETGRLVEWHLARGASEEVLAEDRRRMEAASGAIRRSAGVPSAAQRRREQEEAEAQRRAWEEWHAATARPLAEHVLGDEEQARAVAELEAEIAPGAVGGPARP